MRAFLAYIAAVAQMLWHEFAVHKCPAMTSPVQTTRSALRRKRLAQEMASLAGEDWHSLTADQQSQWAQHADAWQAYCQCQNAPPLTTETIHNRAA